MPQRVGFYYTVGGFKGQYTGWTLVIPGFEKDKQKTILFNKDSVFAKIKWSN